MEKLNNLNQKKTWKREVAFLMFLHLVFVTSVQVNVMLLQVLVFPYIIFMLAAFGLEAAVKQMGLHLDARSPK